MISWTLERTMRESNFKSKKVHKRVMVAAWSYSNSYGTESEDEEIANLCLMARQSSWENNEFVEVIMEYLLTFSKEYLAQGLLKRVKFKQDHTSKIKALINKNKVLKKENETL